MERMESTTRRARTRAGAGEVFLRFLRLGCTSFGGPVAHIGYLRNEFVVRLGWLEEHQFAEVVGLCQFLPGPASSQVGFAVGMLEAGVAGAVAAWVGFTLPSALLMLGFAFGRYWITGRDGTAALHGLMLAAVAVVAQAVWGMRKVLAPDVRRMAIATVAAAILLSWHDGRAQIAALIFGALTGLWLCRTSAEAEGNTPAVPQRAGNWAAGIFLAVLAALPVALRLSPRGGVALFAAFYRTGALVFGGGHVVLPLLEQVTVARGWLDQTTFLAGYGATQAVPGPLFTFAAYLGAVCSPLPGVGGAVIALAAIFLPGLLLVTAVLPHWATLRRRAAMRAVVAGVNASVVGVLAAALYRPVITSAIASLWDATLAAAAFTALVVWRVPPWLVVACTAAATLLIVAAH